MILLYARAGVLLVVRVSLIARQPLVVIAYACVYGVSRQLDNCSRWDDMGVCVRVRSVPLSNAHWYYLGARGGARVGGVVYAMRECSA